MSPCLGNPIPWVTIHMSQYPMNMSPRLGMYLPMQVTRELPLRLAVPLSTCGSPQRLTIPMSMCGYPQRALIPMQVTHGLPLRLAVPMDTRGYPQRLTNPRSTRGHPQCLMGSRSFCRHLSRPMAHLEMCSSLRCSTILKTIPHYQPVLATRPSGIDLDTVQPS